MVKKTIYIKIPSLPNFLFDEKGTSYRVSELTDEELDQIGKEWTRALKEHAKNKRERNEKIR